ncbi:MAG: hypothetical protein R3A44_01570 [Caldilineaceae bacterium]
MRIQRRTMTSIMLLALLMIAVLAACAGAATPAASPGQDSAALVTVYKAPT